jgi:hypothetical protein
VPTLTCGLSRSNFSFDIWFLLRFFQLWSS